MIFNDFDKIEEPNMNPDGVLRRIKPLLLNHFEPKFEPKLSFLPPLSVTSKVRTTKYGRIHWRDTDTEPIHVLSIIFNIFLVSNNLIYRSLQQYHGGLTKADGLSFYYLVHLLMKYFNNMISKWIIMILVSV